MKRLFLLSLLLSVTLVSTSVRSFAQCKSMAKKRIPQLAPFSFSGQLNVLNLEAGNKASLTGALLGGQEYRVLVCRAMEGALFFKILDKNKKVLFDSKEHDNVLSWDFKVNSTENYTIQVAIPEGDSGASGNPDCVAILVGFKVP